MGQDCNPVDKDTLALEMALLRDSFTKSVTVRIDLPAGTVLKQEHLTVKKPGTGIPASNFYDLIGRRLQRNVSANQLLHVDDLEKWDNQ
jgi:N,N'-diacetyllegionaminate synthase